MTFKPDLARKRIDKWINFLRNTNNRPTDPSDEELGSLLASFDPDRYRDQMESSRKRLEKSARFEEPDRVPVTISASGSYFSKLKDGPFSMDYNLRDYYTNYKLGFKVQLQGMKWAFELLRDDRTGYSLHVDLGPIGEGVLFGLKIIYPNDSSPWIVRGLESKQDVEKFIEMEVPPPEEHPGIRFVEELKEEAQEFVESLGSNLSVGGGIGIHPPLSASCSLMEPARVVKLMYTDPDLIDRLFQKLADDKVRLHEYQERKYSVKIRDFGLADDHMLMLSPDQYRRFEMPHVMMMYRRFGTRSRHLHGDGPNDHLFQILADEMKLTSMDIGGFSSIDKAAQYLKGKVNFSGGLNCKDLYYGTSFDHVKNRIDHCLDVAGQGGGYTLAIGGETYVGVDPALLRRAVQYVKVAGKLPRE